MENDDNGRKRFKRFIRARLHGVQRQDIEDVAQESHWRMLRLLQRGGSVDDPESYINRIAINVANDFAVKDANERKVVIVDSDELAQHLNQVEAPAWLHDVQKVVELEQELEWLTHNLPPQELAVLILCERDGYTYKEAAAELNVPVGTIHRRLADAKAYCQRRAKSRLTRGNVK